MKMCKICLVKWNAFEKRALKTKKFGIQNRCCLAEEQNQYRKDSFA